jgi:hypothetical protein
MFKDATDIRIRPEIRAGELLREMAKRGERQKPGDAIGTNSRVRRPLVPSLTDLGITKSQSSRWQALAQIPNEQREERIAMATEIRKRAERRLGEMMAKQPKARPVPSENSIRLTRGLWRIRT